MEAVKKMIMDGIEGLKELVGDAKYADLAEDTRKYVRDHWSEVKGLFVMAEDVFSRGQTVMLTIARMQVQFRLREGDGFSKNALLRWNRTIKEGLTALAGMIPGAKASTVSQYLSWGSTILGNVGKKLPSGRTLTFAEVLEAVAMSEDGEVYDPDKDGSEWTKLYRECVGEPAKADPIAEMAVKMSKMSAAEAYQVLVKSGHKDAVVALAQEAQEVQEAAEAAA